MGVLRTLFTKWSYHTKAKEEVWTQPQLEALLDMLILAMMVDGHMNEDEWSALHGSLVKLEWRSQMSFERYMTEAIHDVDTHLVTQDSIHARCEDIGLRLETVYAREHAYTGAAYIVCSDGAFHPTERGLMGLLIPTLPIEPVRAKELFAQAHKAYMLL